LMKRRNFLTSLTFLAGATGLSPVRAFGQNGPADRPYEGAILKAGPYLQFPEPDSITVRWLTNVPCFAWVEYGETPDKLDRKAETFTDGLVQAYNTVHAIRLR